MPPTSVGSALTRFTTPCEPSTYKKVYIVKVYRREKEKSLKKVKNFFSVLVGTVVYFRRLIGCVKFYRKVQFVDAPIYQEEGGKAQPFLSTFETLRLPPMKIGAHALTECVGDLDWYF